MTFCLHTLIQLAPQYADSIDFYCDCAMELPTRYYMNLVYATKEEYQARSYRVMDTIWAYSQNPGFHTLLQFWGGSAKDLAEIYSIPLETVEKWENKEVAPDYILELILSDMLTDELEQFLRIKSNDELEYYEDDEYDEYY